MAYWQTSKEQRARYKAKCNERAKQRKKNKTKTVVILHKLMSKLLDLMKDSGYNNLTLSEYSGVSPATITRLKRRRKFDTATFSSVVGLARASGYKVEFVRLTPEEDDFFDKRWLKASDFYDKKGDEEGENTGK